MELYPADVDVLADGPLDSAALAARFAAVRRASLRIAEPLEAEDCCVQSMPDVSPTKWHLAHTSWFFETFVLSLEIPSYSSPHPQYAVMFNSYYNTVGDQHARPHRGLLSRPTLAEVVRYRAHVDEAMTELLASGRLDAERLAVVEQGLQHEQQHQELMLMDIKHVFSCNPLRPAYLPAEDRAPTAVRDLNWMTFDGRVEWVGHESAAFAFDNESPRHRKFIESFEIADRLTTCGEFLAFIEDDGYRRPDLWLADGWAAVQERGWNAPLYWEQREDGAWRVMTLHGMRDLDHGEPVTHVSYYEADAFARWSGGWLPQEGAWEVVARELPIDGNFLEAGRFHPAACAGTSATHPEQMYGDVWEWTCSPYSHYPGYRPVDGALGEYNGKFMCNQMVLRGGSCVTPSSHMRATYRNFYAPDARWPFTGIRLTRQVNG